MSLILKWEDTQVGSLVLPQGGIYRDCIVMVTGIGQCGLFHYMSRHGRERGCRVCHLPTTIEWASSMTVAEYIDFFLAMCGREVTEGERERVMQVCNILSYKSTRIDTFLIKRVLLACILLGRHADLYLLDNPFLGMDLLTTHAILSLLQEIKQDACIVISQPTPSSGLQYVDEQWLIRDGMVLFLGGVGHNPSRRNHHHQDTLQEDNLPTCGTGYEASVVSMACVEGVYCAVDIFLSFPCALARYPIIAHCSE